LKNGLLNIAWPFIKNLKFPNEYKRFNLMCQQNFFLKKTFEIKIASSLSDLENNTSGEQQDFCSLVD
jgi:hypothetical protein